MAESKIVKGFRDVFDSLKKNGQLYGPCDFSTCSQRDADCEGRRNYIECSFYIPSNGGGRQNA